MNKLSSYTALFIILLGILALDVWIVSKWWPNPLALIEGVIVGILICGLVFAKFSAHESKPQRYGDLDSKIEEWSRLRLIYRRDPRRPT